MVKSLKLTTIHRRDEIYNEAYYLTTTNALVRACVLFVRSCTCVKGARVCVCVCACERACVYVCACECVCVYVCIINASLSSSVVPPPMKHAVVIPILKKRCSDVNILTNYRPISNIAFVAKLTERFVAQHLQLFMDVNGYYIRSLPKRIPPITQCRVSASTHSQRRGAVH